MRRRKTGLVCGMWLVAALFALSAAFIGCGGGGGGGSAPATSVIQGTVSGTVVMGIDENGGIEDKDDTAGRSPVNTTLPPKYPFSIKVRHGHKYRFHFIVGHGTPSERIVPFKSGTTDIFSIGNAGTIDLGFVDTSQATATAQNDPLTQPGCTSGGQSGPKTLLVEGYKYLNLIDNTDGTVKYRAQAQVKDTAGNPLTSGALVKTMKVYDNSWKELSPDGNLIFWNGSGMYLDTAGNQVLTPQSDMEMYLAASPRSLPQGFYTVAITDNNGNLYTTAVYSSSARSVSKASNLQQVINADNSITLSWTNPPQITSNIYGEYLIYVAILSNDLNGDGIADSILYAIRGLPTGSYTIPASFVSSNLVGKGGLRWRVEIRQRTPASILFPDGTFLQPQFYRNYSATSNLTLPGPPVSGSFSQSDLAGTWDLVIFQNGNNPGWRRLTLTINGSGALTVTSSLDSTGDTTNPTSNSFIWTISAAGVVSEGGAGGNASFHGQMSSNKQLVFGTADWGTDNTATLRVARKRTGTAFSNADLANKTLTLHILHTGTDNEWFYGAGTTDGSGLFTFTSAVKPSGPVPSESGGVLSVNSAGILTTPGNTAWYGLMTDDKKVIFFIDSNSTGSSSFGVFTVTGQTYTQSDYAGTWNFTSIRNTVPNPFWAYGVTSIDAAGTGTYLSFTDSVGSPTPANYSRVLSASGVVTDPADATSHGQLSYNKDISVRTNTNASGRYGLVIGFK